MSAAQPGRVKELWYKWKSLRLPWRKKWLVGRDLTGTTFWELRNPLLPTRPRRIAQYPSTVHYSDVSHSPAWMQWLRYTRPSPPSVTEQQHEQLRQSNLKQLASAADARWAAKPSYLDKPEETGQVGPMLRPRDPAGYLGQTEERARQGVMNAAKSDLEKEAALRGEYVDQGRFKGESAERPREGREPMGDQEVEQKDVQGRGMSMRERKEKENPWEKNYKGPSEGWQPQAWTPGRAERR